MHEHNRPFRVQERTDKLLMQRELEREY